MAARPSTLRSLSKLTPSAAPRRALHITGPATYPSTILTETRSGSSRPSDASDASKRPTAAAADSSATTRQFNTSRSLKAVGDSSTIDFAYLPEFGYDAESDTGARVPLLPDTHYSGLNARAMHEETAGEILKPLINLISADSTHIHAPSAMSEVHDNTTVSFEGLSSSLLGTQGAEEKSVGKQLWDGLLDDLFGEKKTK